MKKLFLCDIDGTILDGSRHMEDVSEKTKYAIKELSKTDYVFIASGRCKGLLDKQIIDLGANGYILCNGAYAEIENKEIYSYSFDDITVRNIIDISLKNNGFYVLESLNHMFVNDLKAPVFINFLNGWRCSLANYKNRDDLSHRYHIAMAGFACEEDCLKAEQELNKYVDARRHNGFKSYDLNIKGMDKGFGAKKIMEYLHIDPKDAYCFGDGINDLEMLQAVGNPVIMANADPRLKQYNFTETDDVLNDGFYHYLVNNNLIKPM